MPKNNARASAHPDEPWLWKKSWAEGRIRGSAQGLVGPLLFGVVWPLICIPMWYIVYRGELGGKGSPILWIAGAFSAMSVVLVAWAIVSLLRWRKYGRSVFEMASVPGVIGGQLAGVVRAPVKIDAIDAFRVKLSCIHCVQRSGSDHISRNLLWQAEHLVARDLLERDTHRSGIPVLFQIPYDCRPTDNEDPKSAVYWNLEATANTPGLDFHAEFEVPVFKTPQSDPHFVVDSDLASKYIAAEDPQRDLRDAGVVKTPSPTGDGYQFVFPMARQPGTAVACTLAGALLFLPCLITYLEFGWGILFFAVLFPIFGLLLLWSALDLWFYRCVVDASRLGLRVAGGLFGGRVEHWIDRADIVKIDVTSNMKSEKMAYYDVIVVRRGGKKITAAKRLPGRRLTDSVIRQIEQAMGKE
jgi:hypothetical protein